MKTSTSTVAIAIGKRQKHAGFHAFALASWVAMVTTVLALALSKQSVEAFAVTTTGCVGSPIRFHSRTTAHTTCLAMAPPSKGSSTMKPAAMPLMDSGKAMARSGELLVDVTNALDLYGGALSAAGANIRIAGDCLAQAAASCRFKTGLEVVIDELRESATCLTEASVKLVLAAEEAAADQDLVLRDSIDAMVPPTNLCATKLEEAGARILMRQGLRSVGESLIEAAEGVEAMADGIGNLAEQSNQNADGILSAQRMRFASERLTQAGIELKGDVDNSKKSEGRAFLKGGF